MDVHGCPWMFHTRLHGGGAMHHPLALGWCTIVLTSCNRQFIHTKPTNHHPLLGNQQQCSENMTKNFEPRSTFICSLWCVQTLKFTDLFTLHTRNYVDTPSRGHSVQHTRIENHELGQSLHAAAGARGRSPDHDTASFTRVPSIARYLHHHR